MHGWDNMCEQPYDNQFLALTETKYSYIGALMSRGNRRYTGTFFMVSGNPLMPLQPYRLYPVTTGQGGKPNTLHGACICARREPCTQPYSS